MRARELHAGDDVGSASAACDQGRPPVNHGIVDRARGVVAVVARPQYRATQARVEFRDTSFSEYRVRA
jgi:hypothetical protein